MERLRWRDLTFRERLWIFVVVVVLLFLVGWSLDRLGLVGGDEGGGRVIPPPTRTG